MHRGVFGEEHKWYESKDFVQPNTQIKHWRFVQQEVVLIQTPAPI